MNDKQRKPDYAQRPSNTSANPRQTLSLVNFLGYLALSFELLEKNIVVPVRNRQQPDRPAEKLALTEPHVVYVTRNSWLGLARLFAITGLFAWCCGFLVWHGFWLMCLDRWRLTCASAGRV